METKGKGTIIVSSIFLLIFGGIVIGLMTAILMNGGYELMTEDKLNYTAAITAGGAYVIGLLDIVAAIFGFAFAGKKEKSKAIIRMGVVLMVATLLWFIPEAIAKEETINWYVYGFSVALPALYYAGGQRNAK